MAHIKLSNQFPGIIGLMHQYPETAAPLNQLAETLLRSPHSLTMGERELIAAYTSQQNRCNFCFSSHAAVANHHHGNSEFVQKIVSGASYDELSDKMKALLNISEKVAQSGLAVQQDDISAAKKAGATDDEIHMTVLISAAFCMFNRYVDGLGTWSPVGMSHYSDIGAQLAEQGYINSIP
jgi:uncharacterized peroxidase-related enzyme